MLQLRGICVQYQTRPRRVFLLVPATREIRPYRGAYPDLATRTDGCTSRCTILLRMSSGYSLAIPGYTPIWRAIPRMCRRSATWSTPSALMYPCHCAPRSTGLAALQHLIAVRQRSSSTEEQRSAGSIAPPQHHMPAQVMSITISNCTNANQAGDDRDGCIVRRDLTPGLFSETAAGVCS